jgi:hypothetical protein
MERGNKWQDVRGCEAPQVVTGDHNSDINSVFSVPLVHAGRVLGALTFESKNRFAFQSHRTWVANRLAAIAADALAAARAAASSRVLGMTSLLAVKLHDLKKAVELLLSAEKELTNESMIKAIRGALEFLSPLFGSASRDDSAILDMSRDDPDWLTALDRGEDVPVKLLYGNVLKGLCDQRGYYPTLRDRDLDPIAGLLVGAADVRPAAIAIHAVLDNVLKESKADGFRYLAEGKKRPVRIIGESRTKWGTTFANLKILGPCVAPELLQVLYQFPYRRDQEDGSERAGKPHFGAFIAGNGMRGIGGDVYVELLTEGSLCTVIQIPVTWRSET